MKVLFISLLVLLAGCTPQTTWERPEGRDDRKLKGDAAECKTYGRDMANEQRKGLKIPGASPHAGAAEAFIVYGMFEEAFVICMETKGWTRKEK
jgi:hypothetical protein